MDGAQSLWRRPKITSGPTTMTWPEHRRHGCIHAVPVQPDGLVDQVMADAIEPTLAELRAGESTIGVLFAGLMLTPRGPRCSSTTSVSAIRKRR